MKKLALLILLLFLALPIFADLLLGIEGGYTLGFYSTDGERREGRSDNPSSSLSVSIPFEWEINRKFSLNTGITYIGRSYKSTTSHSGSTSKIIREGNNYFEFPLSLRYYYLDQGIVRAYFGLGGYIGVRFLSMEGGSRANIFESSSIRYWQIKDFTPYDNLLSLGLLGELGIKIDIFERGDLVVKARYDMSLYSLNNYGYKGSVKEYMDSLMVSISYLWRLDG